MNSSQQNKLNKVFSDTFQPIFNGNLYQWASQNVVLPEVYAINGRFNVEVSPYLKKPMADITDDSVRQINLACSTQTFKSGIQEVAMPFVILQDPSPILRIHQNQAAAAICMQTRIIPMLKLNANTSTLTRLVQYNGKTGMYNLGNMFIKAVGTAESNLHSLSIKYAICDEVWLYDDDNVINKVRARTTAFEKNYKLILTSQPDVEGSQMHKEYAKGNIYHYGWTCPSCKKLQLYEFQGESEGKYYGLNWTKQDEAESLTYDQRTDHTVLTCKQCFHNVEDTEQNRVSLVQNGNYIQLAVGDASIHSYSWPAFVNKDITFKKVAMKYIAAKQVYNKTGIDNDLKLFRNQVLGLFWRKGEVIDTPKLLQDCTTSSEAWTDETHRFLTIDVQQSCIYWLITAWSNKVSEARLIDWGVCVGYDELVKIKEKYNIKPIAIGIDSGDDTVPIYKESILRGAWYERPKDKQKIWASWQCLKGDGGKISPKIDYIHPDGSKKYYGVETRPDPQWPANSKFSNHRARLCLWSNYSIKTLLTNMIAGRLPFKFKFNERADETFTAHMYSEYLDNKAGRFVKKEGIENHLWDCMCMAVVIALMSKCYIPEASLAESTAIKQAKDTIAIPATVPLQS